MLRDQEVSNLLKDTPSFVIYHPNLDTYECERGLVLINLPGQ